MTEKFTFRNSNTKLLNIKKANGIYLYSSKDKILDTTSGGVSYAVLGWNNKEINKSIQTQLRKFSHLDYKTFKDDNVERLSKILLSRAEHKLDSVYFSGSSGGEACEAAMKMSYLKHCADGNNSKVWFIVVPCASPSITLITCLWYSSVVCSTINFVLIPLSTREIS